MSSFSHVLLQRNLSLRYVTYVTNRILIKLCFLTDLCHAYVVFVKDKVRHKQICFVSCTKNPITTRFLKPSNYDIGHGNCIEIAWKLHFQQSRQVEI